MPKLKLPPMAVARTPHLRAFEKELISLNRFYWIFRCSASYTVAEGSKYSRVKDFISPDLAANVDVTMEQFSTLVPAAELTARYTIMVQAVTLFETYLADVLGQMLLSGWRDTKTYTIRFRPVDLPKSDLFEHMQALAVKTEVDSIIASKYAERGARIIRLLEENGFPAPQSPQLQNPLVTAACEVRNSIVHAGAKADTRAIAALSILFPGLKQGDPLPLGEKQTWDLVSAIRDDARAIDYSLRRSADERAQVQREAKRTRKAERHAINQAMAAKHGSKKKR